MQDDKTELPEGTDKIVSGASTPTSAGGEDGDVLLVADVGQPTSRAGRDAILDKIRSGREKLSSQAADKTRGLVTQGLEKSAEALANVGKLVGDTADGLDERLGAEYGDYARRAATAIDDAANSLATKDADELIDDTREFVRQSPGVALAGAAIIGFALARLIKTGLARDDETRATATAPARAASARNNAQAGRSTAAWAGTKTARSASSSAGWSTRARPMPRPRSAWPKRSPRPRLTASRCRRSCSAPLSSLASGGDRPGGGAVPRAAAADRADVRRDRGVRHLRGHCRRARLAGGPDDPARAVSSRHARDRGGADRGRAGAGAADRHRPRTAG